MTKPTLALCMIIKDEAENLPGVLASVDGLVDEVVVCDTGSMDRSMSIASDHGAKVVEFAWCDDFSAARNAALDAVTSDWVLVLDADEILAPISRKYLDSLLGDDSAAGFEVTMKSQCHGETQEFQIVRLFRNHPSVRYQFPIHEQIIIALNPWARDNNQSIKISSLLIEHSGYEPGRRQAKRPRNQKLLEQAVAEFPDEPYLRFQLGAEGLSLFRGEVVPVKGMQAAAAHLQQAWEMVHHQGVDPGTEYPWLPDLAGLLGSFQTVSGNSRQALQLLSPVGRQFPDHRNLALPLCLAVLDLASHKAGSMPDLAREMSAVALRLDSANRGRVLGEVEIVLGNYDLGQQHFKAVLEDNPQDTFALLGMGRCLTGKSQAQKALAYVLQAVEHGEWNWRAWVQGAVLMEHLGLSEKALKWRGIFAEHFPDHPLSRKDIE